MPKQLILVLPEASLEPIATNLRSIQDRGLGIVAKTLYAELHPYATYVAFYDTESRAGYEHANPYARNSDNRPKAIWNLLGSDEMPDGTLPRVLITVEGGVVGDVCSDRPMQYLLKDFDVIKQGRMFDPLGFEQCSLENPDGFAQAITEDVEECQLVNGAPKKAQPTYLPGKHYWIRQRLYGHAPWDEWALYWFDHFEPLGGFRRSIGDAVNIRLEQVQFYPARYEIIPAQPPTENSEDG